MSETEARQHLVRLRLPCSSGYLVLARVAVGALCARLDYSVEQLDDLKLAVDEACSLLIAEALPGETLELNLAPDPDGHLTITACARTRTGKAPRRGSFAWTVLTALADQVEASTDAGLVCIELTAMRRGSVTESPVDA